MVNSNSYVLLAKIVATKGLKGEVKLKSFTEDPLAIMEYDIFDEQNNHYTITKAYIHKTIVVAKIAGIDSINDAEKLINKSLYTSKESLPALAEDDSYYHIDLIGLDVFTVNKEHFGKITAIFDFGAGDILEILQDNQEKVFISFTKKNVLEVNLPKKYITIASLSYIDFEYEPDNK
ncbi:Ribosome maturation factor RimM [Candidatus Hepatincola sp. Av]